VTPTLSVLAVQVRASCEDEGEVAEIPVGVEGAVVSGVIENVYLREKCVSSRATPELKRCSVVSGGECVFEVIFFVLGRNLNPKEIFLIRDAPIIEQCARSFIGELENEKSAAGILDF
jgi:hypothetical protein